MTPRPILPLVASGLAIAFAACGGADAVGPSNRPTPPIAAASTTATASSPPTQATPPSTVPAEPPRDPEPGPLNVVGTDPQRGDPLAPVTVVEVIVPRDAASRALAIALGKLEQQLGPRKLRRVLRTHAPAREDALVARAEVAVLRAGGAAALLAFHDTLVGIKDGPLDEPRLLEIAVGSGLSRDRIASLMSSAEVTAELEQRTTSARKLGVAGPTLFVNGFECSRRTGFGGTDAKRLTVRLEAVLEEELSRARSAMIDGVPAHEVSARRSAENMAVPRPLPEALADDEQIPLRVPVDGSPARGPATAPVTIVQFSDFQCPFCSIVQSTLTEIERKYPGKVRMVWKNNPLPFHRRAEPASELAMEAFAQRGDAGFWRVYDRIWKQQHRLEDLDLLGIGAASGINTLKVKDAIAKKAHAAVIQRDMDLARRLRVAGAPQFFVNGRRLAGAQSLVAFAQVIDEEIALADQLVASGVAPKDLYDEAMKRSFEPPPVPPPATPPTPPPRPPNPRFIDPLSDD